jgi:hypothetical protein
MEETVSATTIAAPTGFADGATQLGLSALDVDQLVALRAAGDCARVQEKMAALVDTRLAQAQAELDAALAEQAAAGGVGGGADVEPLARSIPLARQAGRLQAAAAILTGPSTVDAAIAADTVDNSSGCTDECACSRAAVVTSGPFAFGVEGTVNTQGQPIVCTLDADGGDMTARIGDWQAMLVQATGRGHTDDGIAVTFGHDIARTAELARLLAAEYSCCSFASYHLTIDGRGVRMEIRTPPEARSAYAAVFGLDD